MNEIIAEIRQQLKNGKTSESEIKISFKLPEPKHGVQAHVIFSEVAANKIRMLVSEAKEEVGWHGTARRDEESISVFHIDDVFVFPQEVTGTTVTPDETEYAMWLAGLPDDVFNNLRFHGHSHVNMGTSPSAVDTNFQNNILQNLQDFYIFGIFNKRDNNCMSIFDVVNNIIYEDKDIIYSAQLNPEHSWAVEQLDTLVKKKTYAATKTQTTTTTKGNKKNEAKLSPGEKSMQEARERSSEEYYGLGTYAQEWYERFYGNAHTQDDREDTK